MGSRISGFYKLTVDERLEKISSMIPLTNKEKNMMKGKQGFTLKHADEMIENVIGFFPVPLGVAVNFKVNGKDVFIPMATEEPSVIAAASHAATYTYEAGGFHTSYSGSLMRGQIQVINVKNPYASLLKVYENKDMIIKFCNEQDPTLVSLGGGVKDVEGEVFQTDKGDMLIIHLIVDTKDAMGANAVNTMAEAVAPVIEELTEGEVVLRILSNLADRRIVRVRAVFRDPFNGNKKKLEKFMSAYQLSCLDPYRAATHNKGIMNGISAVVLATGNDTRAVEAGAHAYAARNGKYETLTRWESTENGSVVGTIEMPLAVGLVGGATQSHPTAQLALKLIQANSSKDLAGMIAAVGLAQNFAALKALADDGIQKGHMKLHARNMAQMAGATDDEVEEVIQLASQNNSYRFHDIKEIVKSLKTR